MLIEVNVQCTPKDLQNLFKTWEDDECLPHSLVLSSSSATMTLFFIQFDLKILHVPHIECYISLTEMLKKFYNKKDLHAGEIVDELVHTV